MWRHRIILVALALACSCNIPDVSKINLSECMHGCNDDARTCLDDANAKLTACDPDAGNSLCEVGIIQESEDCLTTCLDCIDACVAVTENQLKQ